MPGERTRNLRHELRTPVNHLVGYADLLLEEPDLPRPLGESLARVRSAAQELLPAIASLLDGEEAVVPDVLAELRQVAGRIAEQVQVALASGDDSVAADLDRIRSASARLQELLGDISRVGRAAVPGAVHATATDEATGPLILVVDDDSTNRDVLGRRLGRLGYRVVEANDGAKALEILGQGGIDLVLLDLMMPVVDGLAVLQQRQRDERLHDTPVIMISALDEVESIARCIELGADDYLTKPFDPVLLRARVGASLQKKLLHDREKQLLQTVSQQAEELRAWNAQLERRVAEKVREVERLSLMERFVPPQLADVIRSGGADLLLSHRREIAVLFCDLRGFTSFAETSEPEDVMSVLRELHEGVGPLIFELGGTLAYFTGDGMMVFFNDPVPCEDPAWQSILLALGMRERAAHLSAEWKRRGHALELGIGVAMGYATCGQVGFDGRYEYTAIGTVINLAARLCGEAAGGQILANERLAGLVADRVGSTRVGDLVLKGLARPVPVYALA
ncbi:MAG: response regulator [Dehalococcoidia bacterium]